MQNALRSTRATSALYRATNRSAFVVLGERSFMVRGLDGACYRTAHLFLADAWGQAGDSRRNQANATAGWRAFPLTMG
jgi:hypothetical protein